MSWADKSLKEFQDALASDAPTPGGGSAVGVALGQAAALSIMVCELTLSNEKYKDGWSISERIKEIATPMLILGLDLSLRDSEAFDEVVDSFRLPNDTEEERLNRRLAIRKATLGAAEVPYQTALSALDLLKLLPALAEKGNSNAVSDIGVAGLLASTALKGAVFNVQINLQSLPDDYGVEMRKNLPSLIEEGRLYSRKCMDVVRMQLADS